MLQALQAILDLAESGVAGATICLNSSITYLSRFRVYRMPLPLKEFEKLCTCFFFALSAAAAASSAALTSWEFPTRDALCVLHRKRGRLQIFSKQIIDGVKDSSRESPERSNKIRTNI